MKKKFTIEFDPETAYIKIEHDTLYFREFILMLMYEIMAFADEEISEASQVEILGHEFKTVSKKEEKEMKDKFIKDIFYELTNVYEKTKSKEKITLLNW